MSIDIYSPGFLEQYLLGDKKIDHIVEGMEYNLTGTHLKEILQNYRKLWEAANQQPVSVKDTNSPVRKQSEGECIQTDQPDENTVRQIFDIINSCRHYWDAAERIAATFYAPKRESHVVDAQAAPEIPLEPGAVVWVPHPSPWQPIDTAPKDGTRILIAESTNTPIKRWWVSEAKYYDEQEGWWASNTHPTDYTDGQCYPSHWMPLPAPPITKIEGGK